MKQFSRTVRARRSPKFKSSKGVSHFQYPGHAKRRFLKVRRRRPAPKAPAASLSLPRLYFSYRIIKKSTKS